MRPMEKRSAKPRAQPERREGIRDFLENLRGAHGWAWLSLALLVIVCWTFGSAINNDFIGFDDPDYVTANGHVQQGLSAQSLAWAFSNSDSANWHPLTWISHMVDCQLFDAQAWGHHLTSIFLHALNTVLLFLVLIALTGTT